MAATPSLLALLGLLIMSASFKTTKMSVDGSEETITCFQSVRSEETEQIDYMMIVFKQSFIVSQNIEVSLLICPNL
jgi:hypothetical protein